MEPKMVLVFTRDSLMQEMLCELLKSGGHTPNQSSERGDALKKLDLVRHGIIVSGWSSMLDPLFCNKPFIGVIRTSGQLFANIPVLVVSGGRTDTEITAALKAGVTGVLVWENLLRLPREYLLGKIEEIFAEE